MDNFMNVDSGIVCIPDICSFLFQCSYKILNLVFLFLVSVLEIHILCSLQTTVRSSVVDVILCSVLFPAQLKFFIKVLIILIKEYMVYGLRTFV